MKWIKCHSCRYVSKYSTLFKAHMKSHDGDKQSELNQTQTSTSTDHQKRNRSKRKQYSAGEKPFKCTECPFTSSDYGHLLHHMRLNHTRKRLKSAFEAHSEMYSTEKLRALDFPQEDVPSDQVYINSHTNPQASVNESVLNTESTAGNSNYLPISTHSSQNGKCPPEKEIDQLDDDNCSIDMNAGINSIASTPSAVNIGTDQTMHTEDIPSDQVSSNSHTNPQVLVSESVLNTTLSGGNSNYLPISNYSFPIGKFTPEKEIDQVDDDNCSIDMNAGISRPNAIIVGTDRKMHTDKICVNVLNIEKYNANIFTDTQTTVNESVIDSAPVVLTSLTPVGIPSWAFSNASRVSQFDVDNCSIDMYSGMKPMTTSMLYENFCENNEEFYVECAVDYDYVNEIWSL